MNRKSKNTTGLERLQKIVDGNVKYEARIKFIEASYIEMRLGLEAIINHYNAFTEKTPAVDLWRIAKDTMEKVSKIKKEDFSE